MCESLDSWGYVWSEVHTLFYKVKLSVLCAQKPLEDVTMNIASAVVVFSTLLTARSSRARDTAMSLLCSWGMNSDSPGFICECQKWRGNMPCTDALWEKKDLVPPLLSKAAGDLLGEGRCQSVLSRTKGIKKNNLLDYCCYLEGGKRHSWLLVGHGNVEGPIP